MFLDRQWAGFIERFAAAFYFDKNIFELEQLSENFWYWKVFVCETKIDSFENWYKKENIYIYFHSSHFQILKKENNH